MVDHFCEMFALEVIRRNVKAFTMALIYTNACIYSPVVACLWVLHVHLKLNERLDYSVQADHVGVSE